MYWFLSYRTFSFSLLFSLTAERPRALFQTIPVTVETSRMITCYLDDKNQHRVYFHRTSSVSTAVLPKRERSVSWLQSRKGHRERRMEGVSETSNMDFNTCHRWSVPISYWHSTLVSSNHNHHHSLPLKTLHAHTKPLLLPVSFAVLMLAIIVISTQATRWTSPNYRHSSTLLQPQKSSNQPGNSKRLCGCAGPSTKGSLFSHQRKSPITWL